MPGPIAAAGIMAGGSILGGLLGGGSDNKAGGQPMYAYANMPPWLQEKFTSSMKGMPAQTTLGFGGQQYPMTYGPLQRTAQNLYSASSYMPYQTPAPSPFTGAMTAAAPFMYQWAMQQPQNPVAAATQNPSWFTPGDMFTGYWR